MKKILLIILSFPITLVLYILLFSGDVKYSEEIVINANIDTVVALFDNPYNMKEYMEGFENYKLLEGKINEVGAKAEIIINFVEPGKEEQKIVMIEEIVTNNLPLEKTIIYTANGVYNIVNNRIIKISETQTKFINEQEFRFNGYMKIIGFFMPSAFRQQSRVYLQNFKAFVENR